MEINNSGFIRINGSNRLKYIERNNQAIHSRNCFLAGKAKFYLVSLNQS